MTVDDTDTSETSAHILCKRLHRMPDDRLPTPEDRIAYYIGAARAPATHRAYATDIAAFLAWGGAVPATPQVVAGYLAGSEDLAVSTLRRRLAAIADAHQTGGYPDPTKHPLVRKVFRGIRRVRGAEVLAPDPLDASMLSAMIGAMPEDLAGKRDRALLLVGFFCALRRSELVSLCVTDVHTSADGWTVNIRRSKTDQNAAGQRVSLPSRRQRRLSDAYLFVGLRAQGTVRGVFGDPDVRIINLDRRSKKPCAAVAGWRRGAGTTGACGRFGICRAGRFGSSWNWRCGAFSAGGAGR
jgi:integrase